MKKTITLLLALLCSYFSARAQQETFSLDSIKTRLALAKTPAERVQWLDFLSRTLMNVDLAEAERYGKMLIAEAEESRDRELMVKAYLSNGTRCSYFAGNKVYTGQSIAYFHKALDIAKQNRLNEYVVIALKNLATIHLAIPDKEKAAAFIGQASSALSILDHDSLRAVVHLAQGDVNLARNEKIEALRFYLGALRTAEKLADPQLKRNSFLKLSGFYANIGAYDKAIDNYKWAYEELDRMDEKNVPYQRVIDINTLGNLFAAKKNYDLAIDYHERSLAMADSLHYSNLKVPAYISLLNQYIAMDQPRKALDYFNSDAGKNLKEYLRNFGLSGAIDQAYGFIYTELGVYDSAGYYYGLATPYFEKTSSENIKMSYYLQLAKYFRKTGQSAKAISLLQKVSDMALKTGQLESVEKASLELDSIYAETGNYLLSKQYNATYHLFKDSLGKINKEKELAQVEAQDEQDRQKRLAEEAAEKKRRRNNIQYLAITIGIAAFLVILVVLGMFKVSEGMIKALGFFVFIMLFEFIFLVFKKTITGITNGEPLKDLLFMIGLAALLLPLHHWIEHKVIRYLTSHNRLTSAGQHIKTKLWRKSRSEGT